PEVSGGLHLRYHFARPDPRCVHVGDRFFRNPLLLFARVKDGRTVSGSPVSVLAVERARVVNLEEIFEQFPIREFRGIKNDLDGFRVSPMITISRVTHIAAAVTDPRRKNARVAPDQILHPPKASACQNSSYLSR